MSCWVVTGHDETLIRLGEISPLAEVVCRQMRFLDAPAHTRMRKRCSAAFTPRRVQALKRHIVQIIDDLVDAALPHGRIDMVSDFAERLPAIVIAHLLGMPSEDHLQLTAWSAHFAEMLGNFQHHPGRGGACAQKPG